MKKKEQEKKKIAARQRKYQESNKEKIAEQRSKYYAANKEKKAEYDRKYRAANKEEIAEKDRKRRAANPEKNAEKNRKYYESNKEEIAAKQRIYYEANKKAKAEYNRDYRAANKEEKAEKNRQYYEANKENIAEKNRKYYEANKEDIAAKNRKYHEANKDDISAWGRKYRADPANMERRRAYIRERRRTDPAWAIQSCLSTRLRKIMKGVGGVKPSTTMKIVGCTRDELIAHLASKFKPGMTMDNQGSYWHVDHIMPCAAFDHNIPAQVRTCWHYTNLQPLEAKENMSKGCKITEPQMSLPLSPKKDVEK